MLAALLCHLHHLPVCCYMRLFCCGRLNTSSQGQPLAQGLCYDVKTKLSHCRPSDDTAGAPSQQQLPAAFEARPAALERRSASAQCWKAVHALPSVVLMEDWHVTRKPTLLAPWNSCCDTMAHFKRGSVLQYHVVFGGRRCGGQIWCAGAGCVVSVRYTTAHLRCWCCPVWTCAGPRQHTHSLLQPSVKQTTKFCRCVRRLQMQSCQDLQQVCHKTLP